MECINKNSKEFKELEKATGLSPIALSYEISKYQQMTGKEDFPSQEYLEKALDPVSKKMMIDIDRHTNEFYGSIDNNFLDAIFINSMGRNSQLSVAIEKSVRKQMSMISQATDIPVKYIHSRTQVLPSKEIDGVLVVNLAAVNENTTFEELIKPIKEFINIESINEQTVNISMVSNNSDTIKKEESNVIDEINKRRQHELDENASRIIQKREIWVDAEGRRFAINHGKNGKQILYDVDENNKNLGKIEEYEQGVEPSKFLDNPVKELEQSGDEYYKSLNSKNKTLEQKINDKYDAEIEALNVKDKSKVRSTEGYTSDVLPTGIKEGVESKPVEVREPVSLDLKTKVSDTLELEVFDEIQVYSLPNGQVFKTAEEREIYTRNLLKSNGIEKAVIDKFIANNYALSKLAVRNREVVKNLLEDTVQELKNNLKIESYDYGDNNSKALFDQSPLGQRVQESFDKVLTNQKARGKAKTRRTTDKTTFELDSIALEKSEEPNPNLEKNITEQIESYTRAFDKISRDFHMKYTNELSDSFMQYRNSEYSVADESANTALEKARIIGDKLNVLVKLDNSIPGRGVLLSTSHYLSRNAGKPVILINPDFLTSDTVIHEFGHLYIELLGGIKDPKVQKAIELLQNTKFYDNVKNMYPELSKEELDLEALATAIGFEGDSIFTRDVEKLSFWQSLVRAFIEALKKIFRFSTEDAITSLAKEVIGQSKRRVPKGMLYKNNRNQFSKYFIDPEIEENNRQAAITELFEKIDNAITLDEESHTYHHLGEELVHSITTVAKAMSSKHKAGENKGSFNIPFNKEIINENNILMTLKQPIIPFALARALDNYVFSEIPGVVVNFKMTIHDRSWVDAFNRALNDIDLEIENENNFIQGLKDNFEEILNEAERIDTTFNRSSIAGNIVHDAAEKYVHKLVGKGGEVFPENIKNSEKFILQIKDIIDKGMSEGSVFFTEQSLYDEGTRRPGKADLIEITKDGRYRIYDFKTIKSFTRNGHDKSMRELYVSKGYMHQLIAYGQILKKYGIEPAENPYNILMTEVSFDDNLDTNKEVTLGKFKMQSMTDPKLLSEFTEAEGKIRRSFSAGNNLTDINKEEDIKNLDDVANRIAKAVKVYDKNLAPKSTLGTEFIKNLKEVLDSEADKEKMKELRNDYNRYVALNNTVVVKSFIEKIHEVMTVVVMHNENDIDTSSEYLRSVNYVIQMAETLNDIKKMITHDELVKDNKLTETQALGLIQLVDETLQMIHDSKQFYKDKLIRSAIALLAHNSNQSEGALIETLTIEARKKGGRDGKGTNDKFEINKYVQSNIKKRKESLYSNERAYWEAQYSNGLLDLRLTEALIGDPGMLRSQVIQVVKNMMDSNAMGVRTQMLELAPEIDEFNSKMKGINPDGNTQAQWGRFVVKRDIYIPQLDKTENMLSGVIMPEFISDRYLLEEEYFFKKKNLVAKQQFISSKKAYKNQQDDLAAIQEELNELHDELKNKRKKLSTDKKIKNPDLKRVNPEFAKLSDVDKEALRYIHQKLDNSDELIEDRSKRLGMTIKGGTTLRQLPKQRMSTWEATGAGKLLGDLKSKFQDLKRPPADEDEMAFQAGENHGSDYDGAIRTDLKGNPIYDVPVFYRNELEDPRLQSYDIPTLLIENHETSLVHNQNKLLEADLFIIQDSVSSENQKIIKSDNLINKKLKDLSGEYSQISEANHLHKALVSFIDNRLYKRAFSGVFTKQNYRVVKGMNTVTKYASLVSLTLNFKSALSTTLQGTMLRMVEGWAGEYFNMNDWKNGTRKTYADLADVIKDTQNHIPKSKTNLLIKKFGMEPRSNALINKFVQDTLVKKNMDSNALYAVTSIAENNVTSMLMYTLLSSVKVMDKNQNFIDKDGNIVSDEKDAMSLDEAYTVENGKLVLHPKVHFTTQSLINPYKEDSDTGYLASTEISSKMQHIYADMYGQYNEELKSQLQRTAIGKMVMSMKGWLPRGINRRFRGITTSIPFSNSFLTFDEMRDEKNRDKRYYVQALKQYQEGYYTTGLRYLGSLIKELKNNTNTLGAASSVYNSMTTHEKANIKRTMADIAVAILTVMMYKLLAAWAKSMEDDDPETSERLYFTALMTFRLHDELYTFMSPNSMISIVKNPAVAFNSLSNVSNIVDSVFGWEIDNQGDIDFNINNTYEKGSKKGNYKAVESMFKLLPGVNNSRQAGALLGMDTGKSMEDAFKAQIMMDKQK